MWFNLRKYRVEPGAHAEVTGITSRLLGTGQQATLVVTYPGGKTRAANVQGKMTVRGALKFAAKFNAACQTTAGVYQP